LHGISRSSRIMSTLEDALSTESYDVKNIDYPSTSMSMEALAEWVFEKIRPYCQNTRQPIHFVTHSMGGMIARLIIRDHRPTTLGRVVMMAPPNQGSIVADFMQRFWFFRKWFGPAGRQLGTNRDGIHHQLGPADFECAIIAGDRSADPWFSWFLYHGPNDGKVSVENTKLEGMKEQVVIHATHTFLPKNKKAIRLIQNFLRYGTFRVLAAND